MILSVFGSIFLLILFLIKMRHVSTSFILSRDSRQSRSSKISIQSRSPSITTPQRDYQINQINQINQMDRKSTFASQTGKNTTVAKTQTVHTAAEKQKSNGTLNAAIEVAKNLRNVDRMHLELIGIMSKLTCLVLFTLIFTIISIILVIYNIISAKYFASILSITGTSIDITVNAICLMLLLPFANKYYFIFCNFCNDFLIKKFEINIEN